MVKYLATDVVSELKRLNLKVSFAESCTGGLLSATITDIADTSEIFDRGFITYSNTSKQEMIGVENKTITMFGAVSAETAEEMAKGALAYSHADIALAITGVSGPTGLVYICVATTSGYIMIDENNFSGNRHSVRLASITHALEMILKATKTIH